MSKHARKHPALVLVLVLVTILAALPVSAQTGHSTPACNGGSAGPLFPLGEKGLADLGPAGTPVQATSLPFLAPPSIFVGCDDICTCSSSCGRSCWLSPGVPGTCGQVGTCIGSC